MKIKIEFTVDVDAKTIGQYMEDLHAVDETKREFVRSYIISGGIGCLEEALINNGFDHNIIRRVA